MQVRKQPLEPDREEWTGKEYIKAVFCHSANLTCMQSTSCEMSGWMKHKLASRSPGEIPITSDRQMTPPFAESEEELKSLLMKEVSSSSFL